MHSSHTHFFRFVVVKRLLKLKIIVIQVGPSDEANFLGASNFSAILSLSGVYEQTIAVIPIHFHFPNVRTADATLKFAPPRGHGRNERILLLLKLGILIYSKRHEMRNIHEKQVSCSAVVSDFFFYDDARHIVRPRSNVMKSIPRNSSYSFGMI